MIFTFNFIIFIFIIDIMKNFLIIISKKLITRIKAILIWFNTLRINYYLRIEIINSNSLYKKAYELLINNYKIDLLIFTTIIYNKNLFIIGVYI